MSNPTFRALCAELVALDNHCVVECTEEWADVMCRVNAALAQPEPVAPTDEDLLRRYGLAKRNYCYEGPLDDWPKRAERAATIHGLRAVLACYACPTIQPVPVSERPWEQKSHWRDLDGECWWCPPDGPCYWSMVNPAMVYGGWLLPADAIPHPDFDPAYARPTP